MINTLKSLIFLIFISCLFSCNERKKSLLQEFYQVKSLIDEYNFDEIYERLDLESQEYLNYLINNTNTDFETVRLYGKSQGVEYVTLDLINVVKSMESEVPLKPTNILEVFGLMELPMFDLFGKTKVLEDETQTGNKNYVVVAKKVAKNAYISSKVEFTINADLEYKLNILPLLKSRNNLLQQQFKSYIQIKRNKGDESSREKLKETFFEEKDTSSEYNLTQFQYKKKVRR